MAATRTAGYVVQTWSATHRPGKAEDGPPYAPPGAWVTLARHESESRAQEGLARILTPMGDRARDPERYRVIDEKTASREYQLASRKRRKVAA